MAADILVRLLEGLTIAAVVLLVIGTVRWPPTPKGGIALRLYAVAASGMMLALVVALCIAGGLLIYILGQAVVEALNNGWGGGPAYDPPPDY